MSFLRRSAPQERRVDRFPVFRLVPRRFAPQEPNVRPDDFARIIGLYRVHYPCKIAGQLAVRPLEE